MELKDPTPTKPALTCVFSCFCLFLEKKKCTGDGNVQQSHVERSHFLFNLGNIVKTRSDRYEGNVHLKLKNDCYIFGSYRAGGHLCWLLNKWLRKIVVKMKAKWRLGDVVEQWELNRITRRCYIFLYGGQLLLLLTIAWLNTRCFITAHHIFILFTPDVFHSEQSWETFKPKKMARHFLSMTSTSSPDHFFLCLSFFSCSLFHSPSSTNNPRVKTIRSWCYLSFSFYRWKKPIFWLGRLAKYFPRPKMFQHPISGQRSTCFLKRITASSHFSAKRWNFPFFPVLTNREESSSYLYAKVKRVTSLQLVIL